VIPGPVLLQYLVDAGTVEGRAEGRVSVAGVQAVSEALRQRLEA